MNQHDDLRERMKLWDIDHVELSGEDAVDRAYALLEADPDPGVRHSMRFRKVSNRYPLRVTEAYGGDLARAANDSDEQVAVTVAAWERAHGLDPRDWHAIGAEECDEPEARAVRVHPPPRDLGNRNDNDAGEDGERSRP